MRTDNSANNNFWIAYADLMAGLFFVSILLVGAIVVKYIFAKQNLEITEQNLILKEQNLTKTSAELNEKKIALVNLLENLSKVKDKNRQLEILNQIFNTQMIDLKNDRSLLEKKNLEFKQNLAHSHLMINSLNEKISLLKAKFQKQTQDYEAILTDLKNDFNKKEQGFMEQISAQNSEISSANERYNRLLSDFNTAKQKIKALSGIRLAVISKLQKELGKDIKIDQNSGAVTLLASVLFDVDSYELKESSKPYLRQTLQKYLSVLLSDEIASNIDKIIIEGHTDSDGDYLYNLDLSQKRAYEVMKFIYSFNQDAQNYLVASGRSFSDVILRNGKEDKAASRRIEIKFSISSKEAMREIENILELKNR